RRYLEREDNLRQGLTKAYALIFGNYCTKAMQSQVEAHPDFEKEIEKDPLKLLEVIKVLMHDPIRTQYPLISMTNALSHLVNLKQGNDEGLLKYIKRFKHARDVAVSHLGTDLLDQFAEYQEEFKGLTTDSDKKKFKEELFEAWMAYLVIRGSDQSKYGSLTANFVQQYSLGNDQYPRTIEMATDVLSQHPFYLIIFMKIRRSTMCTSKMKKLLRMVLELQALHKRIKTKILFVSFAVNQVTG
ncbi:MAG: hypothetical protein ACP5FR_04015, partial [Candidatus Micrarchaeia archaeon]